MYVDLVCSPTVVQAGRLCLGGTSVLCVSQDPDVPHTLGSTSMLLKFIALD